jgi:hypothetical protein
MAGKTEIDAETIFAQLALFPDDTRSAAVDLLTPEESHAVIVHRLQAATDSTLPVLESMYLSFMCMINH